MYKIYLNDSIMHDPARFRRGYCVLDPIITQEVNTHGSLSFTVPPDHPLYDSVAVLTALITVYDDTEELFYGRVIEITKGWHGSKEVYCEGVLAFLCDSIYPPFGFQGSPETFLKKLLSNHATQLGKHTFSVGDVTVEDSNDYINRSSETALSTWELIQTRLLDTLGGYIQTGKNGAVRYINYLADFTDYSDQVIRFGENLLDITDYITAADVITVLMPYGAEYDADDAGYTKQPDNATYNGNRVTVESVNDGVVYVENATGIALYGYIWGTNIWDDVTEPANLLTKAKAYLDDAILSATTLTIKAVDLHLIDVDTSRIHVGDYVRVVSIPHDIDTWLPCTRIVLDLANPENTEITLGKSGKTLTDRVAGRS